MHRAIAKLIERNASGTTAVSGPMQMVDAARGGGSAQSLVEEEAPEFSSDFASAAWEVYLAKSVVNTLMAHTDRAAVRALMAQLQFCR